MNTRTIGTIALSATALIALGCGAGSTSGDKKVNTPGAVASAGASTSSSAPAPAKPKIPALLPADIKMTVKMLSKECFGSAGCNVEFRVSGVSLPQEKLDPEATYEVSYVFKGLESPKEGTFTLEGDGTYSIDESEFGQTKTSKAKVTVVVTGVEKM